MIKNYVFYDFKGEIKGVITQDDSLPLPSGDFIEVSESDLTDDPSKYYIKLPESIYDPDPYLAQLPLEPHPQAVFNYTDLEWKITDEVKNEVALSQIRSIRNELLAASDWTQGNDTPLDYNQKLLWANYRTELRDITTTYEDVLDATDVTWPTAPVTETDDFGGGYDPNDVDVDLFSIR
jgi:hypothetical protein